MHKETSFVPLKLAEDKAYFDKYILDSLQGIRKKFPDSDISPPTITPTFGLKGNQTGYEVSYNILIRFPVFNQLGD